jgi:dsDNA-binding SOS-regulon protein
MNPFAISRQNDGLRDPVKLPFWVANQRAKISAVLKTGKLPRYCRGGNEKNVARNWESLQRSSELIDVKVDRCKFVKAC